MDDHRTDLETTMVQIAGLQRFLRARLLNALTRLLLVLVLVGGLISALTPGSHFPETASICLAVVVVFATWFVVRYFKIVRSLRTDPVREVARLHQRRAIKNAGFVDTAQSSMVSPRVNERRDSHAPETDAYDALRDIDALGQKSENGMNRTNDPSRGPIE